jgi:tRNA modification GTPase
VGDTIVAIATAAGAGAIGIVRVSGGRAVDVAGTVVRRGGGIVGVEPRVLTRVSIVDPRTDEHLDDAVCVVMPAPRSYTGEDVVEIHAHGGPVLLRLIVERLREAGARLAAPGEFTRRAFLNGRMDLARAEAVALVIEAKTERAVRLAARALDGAIARDAARLRERLLDVIAGLEVLLDFPDDGQGLTGPSATHVVQELAAEAARWRATARRARLVHDGATVSLVGAPNAGKSSLLNALLGSERAIVSPTPGTTRDVVDATISVSGVPVRLLDTAGLAQTTDPIEAEGMRRTRQAMKDSDLLLTVLDSSAQPDRAVLAETRAYARVVVCTKSDLPIHPAAARMPEAVFVSATTGAGIAALRSALTRMVEERVTGDGEEGGVVPSVRQLELLDRLVEALRSAAAALEAAPVDAALVDLGDALAVAGQILGIDVADAVLDRIFATFCVGK